MEVQAKAIVYPVGDLERAKALFGALLDMAPHTDTPYYVGYNVGGTEVSLSPSGAQDGLVGGVCFYDVDALEPAIERLVAAGAEVVRPPRAVGGGMRVATVKDPDGNLLGLRDVTTQG
ncbi:MAG TPA: VOC family protein [Acidimicrobiales bacterium]|nr:VOC family protein [Acidimicrobiales bacterium]